MQSHISKLVIIAKGQPREIEMGQELTIGRGYSNLLRLEGEEISRVHAILYRRNQDIVLRDLDSKNGVFVNGSRIQTATLSSGDELQMGKYILVYDPPAGYNFSALAKARTTSADHTGEEPPQGMDTSGDNLAESMIFRAAVSEDSFATGGAALDPTAVCEEVLLFNRAELDERANLRQGMIADKSLDYQEAFFNILLDRKAHTDGKGPDFITAVLRAIITALAASRGVVILRDRKTDALRPGAVVPENGDVAVNRVVLQSGFGEGKAIICPATSECGLFRDSSTVARDKIYSLISVPLGLSVTSGLIYIDRQGEGDGFNLSHLFTLARIARLLELNMQGAISPT